MRGFVDLHCHWVPGIDDGAPTAADGVEMLRRLHEVGFDTVVATPHMRPGMFDNESGDIQRAYESMRRTLPEPGVPKVELSAEHYFDDVVFERLVTGKALPYPGGNAVLLEFYEIEFPFTIDHRLAQLRREHRLTPVIAHPERYRCIWRSPEILARIVEAGSVALLDSAALVGKYGQRPQECAEHLLAEGLYHAACSDAHRPGDVAQVAAGMKAIEEEYGEEEIAALFYDGPREILEGRVDA